MFRKIIAVLVSLVLFIFTGSNGAPKHTVLNEDECILSAAVISDVHIEGNNFPRYKTFARILKDAKNTERKNDVAVFLGDNTMNGQGIESLLFYGTLAITDIADEYVTVVGNHDVGNGEGSYDRLFDRFSKFNKTTLGMKLEKPYYYKVINGCYFITIGPEDLCVYEMPVSDEQMDFLDETLALAQKDGAPAFVCAHHPYWEVESDRIFDILTKYENVFYISGHTHWFVEEGWTFTTEDGINEINLPRCTELGENDREVFDGTGYAVQLEVYKDEVVGRVRNFYTGEWEESLEYHFPLV